MRRIFLVVIVSACGGGELAERTPLGQGPREKQTIQTIPLKQYEELLAKYTELKRENAALKRGPAQIDGLAEKLGTVERSKDLTETVDVFAPEEAPIQEQERGPQAAAMGIEQEIEEIRGAISLLNEKKYDQALGRLRPLESSKTKQIRVRAKFYTGEVLFAQEQYDLAMQIFEDILAKEAFSGLVLKALGRLVTCSEKLNRKNKQETYYSMLHDFFEN